LGSRGHTLGAFDSQDVHGVRVAVARPSHVLARTDKHRLEVALKSLPCRKEYPGTPWISIQICLHCTSVGIHLWRVSWRACSEQRDAPDDGCSCVKPNALLGR